MFEGTFVVIDLLLTLNFVIYKSVVSNLENYNKIAILLLLIYKLKQNFTSVF